MAALSGGSAEGPSLLNGDLESEAGGLSGAGEMSAAGGYQEEVRGAHIHWALDCRLPAAIVTLPGLTSLGLLCV